jgi:hypothetical protein
MCVLYVIALASFSVVSVACWGIDRVCGNARKTGFCSGSREWPHYLLELRRCHRSQCTAKPPSSYLMETCSPDASLIAG